ncbi:MAG TPA: sigma-54-dependent Fis family transcriptional regulator [Bacteroidetes bacterium]|nr:sigma-54-dependent Fis family transcriptional regulator [Bacteroidota bacterium]
MKPSPAKILLAMPDARVAQEYQDLLQKNGFHAAVCSADFAAVRMALEQQFDLVFWETDLGAERSSQCATLLAHAPELALVFLSSDPAIGDVVAVVRGGARAVLQKPVSAGELLQQVHTELSAGEADGRPDTRKQQQSSDIVGSSFAMQRLRRDIEKIAASDTRVLILGESGTGKELVAENIHRRSRRRSGPFIKVNCAAIPGELIESELFGHEKGAFTGAFSKKQGLMAAADGGTLFLDEIGDMALPTQAKVLRALQENEFIPVGGTDPVPFDARVLAATNKNLREEVKAGRFRNDLYFRLNVLPITIPPLREHISDLDELLASFAGRSSRQGQLPQFSEEAREVLHNYSWPGNVREVQNIVERIMVMLADEVITVEKLLRVVPDLQSDGDAMLPSGAGYHLLDGRHSLREKLDFFEKQVLLQAFARSRGNVSKMARLLKTDRANLHRKLVRYGIK